MYVVYVLYSLKDGKLYIGYSSDLERRLSEHHSGSVNATRDRRPLKLIYYEAYLSELEAKRREKYLKGGNGRLQLKAQLALTFRALHYRFR
jgi:putative endonuclease